MLNLATLFSSFSSAVIGKTGSLSPLEPKEKYIENCINKLSNLIVLLVKTNVCYFFKIISKNEE